MNWLPRVLGDILEEREGDALVTPTSRWTYRKLRERAKQSAGALQSLGIGKGDRVGILLPNGEE